MKQQSSEHGWWRLLELCLKLESPKALDDFFDFFLTYEEKKDLALLNCKRAAERQANPA